MCGAPKDSDDTCSEFVSYIIIIIITVIYLYIKKGKL